MRYKALDCVENRKFKIITLMCFFDFSIQFKPSNRSLLNLHLYHNICIYRARRTKAYELKEKGIGSSLRKMSDQCIVLSKSLEIFRDLYSCSRKYIFDNFYVYIVRDI